MAKLFLLILVLFLYEAASTRLCQRCSCVQDKVRCRLKGLNALLDALIEQRKSYSSFTRLDFRSNKIQNFRDLTQSIMRLFPRATEVDLRDNEDLNELTMEDCTVTTTRHDIIIRVNECSPDGVVSLQTPTTTPRHTPPPNIEGDIGGDVSDDTDNDYNNSDNGDDVDMSTSTNNSDDVDVEGSYIPWWWWLIVLGVVSMIILVGAIYLGHDNPRRYPWRKHFNERNGSQTWVGYCRLI